MFLTSCNFQKYMLITRGVRLTFAWSVWLACNLRSTSESYKTICIIYRKCCLYFSNLVFKVKRTIEQVQNCWVTLFKMSCELFFCGIIKLPVDEGNMSSRLPSSQRERTRHGSALTTETWRVTRVFATERENGQYLHLPLKQKRRRIINQSIKCSWWLMRFFILKKLPREICCCDSLKNSTQFQTKMVKCMTQFQTKSSHKPCPLGHHIPIQLT